MESKLGASQIWWLIELALFDFVLKYQTGHSNRATDALSHCPFNPSCDDSFTESKANSEEFEVISYSSVCEAVDLCLNSIKIPEDLKQEAQNISCGITEEKDENENKIVSSLNAVSTFEHVTPEQMAKEKEKHPILKLVYQLVTAGKKPKTLAIAKIKSKTEEILAPVWKADYEERYTTLIIHQQRCRIPSNGPSNKISSASASTASWWPRSSGDWKMPGAIQYSKMLQSMLKIVHEARLQREITPSRTQYRVL